MKVLLHFLLPAVNFTAAANDYGFLQVFCLKWTHA
jgi:hypothetical protein